jgi:acetolactate decarboxylase
VAIDERLIKALHVETLRKQDLHAEHAPHVLFQASTFESLLESNYDGEVSFAELREHGDLGLGTFDAVDGEMIAVDGEFFRATLDGNVHEVADSRKTPFAIVTFFEPRRWMPSWATPRPRTRCGSTVASTACGRARSPASTSPIRR